MRSLPDGLVLEVGSHEALDEGMCVMEVVSYVAGEPFSDHPACASRALGAFLRSWNDGLPHDERQGLLAYVPRLVVSAGTREQEFERSMLALDWLVRVYTPLWLDQVPTMREHAKDMRALPAIVDDESAAVALPLLRAAKAASWWRCKVEAARAGAGKACRAAAGAAAGDAAGAAAGDAARAASWWSYTMKAARAAARTGYTMENARSVAVYATWAASITSRGAALAPTVAALQHSAHDLVDRMLAVTETQSNAEVLA